MRTHTLATQCFCGSHEVKFNQKTQKWECCKCRRDIGKEHRLPRFYNKGQK